MSDRARWFGRARHLDARRRLVEIWWDTLYRGGWAAGGARALGFQGPLEIDERELTIAARQAIPPLRLAFASDTHAGPTTSRRLLREAFAAIASWKPDALLLGGDYVSFHARHADRLVPLLREIEAPAGKLAVFGNHDLIGDEGYIARRLAEGGVSLLVNETARLAAPWDAISVSGLDNFEEGKPDGARAFAGASAVRLLLMHSPDGLAAASGQRFDLALCGHTHGGQFYRDGRSVLGFKGPLTRKYLHGGLVAADEAGGAPMLVSRGLGCGNLPLRRGANPQVHLLTMRFAPASRG